MDLIHPIFKWLHIIAGVLWIGLLYFFNWVNGHFAATMDADTKRKVVPELMPRALYFFRWGAAWTWFTGFILLLIVFYHGGLTFDDGGSWGTEAFVMIAVTFLGVFLYDFLYKSGLASNVRLITIVSFVLVAAVVYLMKEWAGFSYRSFNIHLGALFGTNMAFNVWFIIWPNQKRALGIVECSPEEKPICLKKAVMASRINTLLSLPMLLSMVMAQNLY